jgi:hypothetical protein
VHAGGYDMLPRSLEAVHDGFLDFVIDQQPYLQGFYTVMEMIGDARRVIGEARVVAQILVFISSDYTLRAPPRPHHCWPSASDSDQKKRHLHKTTAIFACRVAAIAQVLASCIAFRGSDPIDEP